MFFAPAELTSERRDEMIERAARAAVRFGMATPATLALEMHKPVSVIGANLVLLGTPLLALFTGWKLCDEIAFFLMDRANLERLARRIEDLAAEGRLPAGDPPPADDSRSPAAGASDAKEAAA